MFPNQGYCTESWYSVGYIPAVCVPDFVLVNAQWCKTIFEVSLPPGGGEGLGFIKDMTGLSQCGILHLSMDSLEACLHRGLER